MSFAEDLIRFTYFRGRVALYSLLKGLGIGPGDEVALQAFTCVAVPEGIMATGAIPLWVDIERDGFNLDASDLKRKITPKTRAIIVQHTYGIPVDMDAIMSVADSRGIPVIEDCCHTLVSTYKGRRVGTFGIGSFYSFEWGKPIVAGIGGSAMVNDDTLEKSLRQSYSAFQEPGFLTQFKITLQYHAFRFLYRPVFYWPVRSLFHKLGSLGLAESNYNPVGQDRIAEDFSLRMAKPLRKRLQRKLREIDAVTQHSRWVATQYRFGIQSSVVKHPILPDKSDVAFARYPLLTDNKEKFLRAAQKANVELAEWYSTPVHPLKGKELEFVHYEQGMCPNAELRCKQVVTLPVHRSVKEKDIERITKFLNEVD